MYIMDLPSSITACYGRRSQALYNNDLVIYLPILGVVSNNSIYM